MAGPDDDAVDTAPMPLGRSRLRRWSVLLVGGPALLVGLLTLGVGVGGIAGWLAVSGSSAPASLGPPLPGPAPTVPGALLVPPVGAPIVPVPETPTLPTTSTTSETTTSSSPVRTTTHARPSGPVRPTGPPRITLTPTRPPDPPPAPSTVPPSTVPPSTVAPSTVPTGSPQNAPPGATGSAGGLTPR